MLFATYILKDRLFKMESISKKIKDSADNVDAEKSRMLPHLYDMKLAMEEVRLINNFDFVINILDDLNVTINSLNNINTGEELKNACKDISDNMNNIINLCENGYSSEYNDVSRTHSLVIDGLHKLDDIIKSTSNSNRQITLFEPDCYKGNTFCYFENNDNILKYGNSEYPSNAKQYATKVVKGAIYGSMIKNDAFDILIAKCNIEKYLEENMSRLGVVSKKEKEYLRYVYKYARKNGVVLITIPYFRLYKDMCEMISKYFKNLSIFKDNTSHGLLYIYAQKDNSKTVREDEYNYLRRSAINYENTESLFDSNLRYNYRLPQNFINIDMFKGSSLDVEELYDIVENSGAINEAIESQRVEKINENTTRPLLPFNLGQIGLVLTSGCLDGIVDEGNGCYHLVKGRVSKKYEKKSETEDNKVKTEEIISNRVEINILLANGEFKRLT